MILLRFGVAGLYKKKGEGKDIQFLTNNALERYNHHFLCLMLTQILQCSPMLYRKKQQQSRSEISMLERGISSSYI